jgi:hypothetical protein
MSSLRFAFALACLGALTVVPAASAQDRLTSFKTASVGIIIENVDFGAGLAQQGTNGSASTVKSASQMIVPISVSIPVATQWNFDVASVYSMGEAKFTTTPASAKLNGIGDVRMRLSGKLSGDALVLTFGANLPTGIHDLNDEQITALGVLAAPALGIYLPGISSGPSETIGLVSAHRIEDLSYAFGISYERRSAFSPVAALSSGLSSPKFDPGDAIHLSLGGDRLVGEHSFSLAAVADVYTNDQLVASGVDQGSSVKLGPTLGVDASFHIASRTFKDPVIYLSDRTRGSFSRDGQSVAGSSANYLSAGMRAGYQLARSTDLTASVDVWNHSGLTADNSLVTAATTSESATIGLDFHSGEYGFRPFVRMRRGNVDTGIQQTSVSGFSFGTTLVKRF